VLATLGVRVFVPELHPHSFVNSTGAAPSRFYFGAEYGGAVILNRDVYPGIEFEDGNNAKGPFNMLVGVRLGADFSRHLGMELSLEGYEAVLDVKGIGAIGEYAIALILLQLRGKLPMGDGRFCPYALGGLGLAYTEFNDRKPGGENLDVESKSFSFAAGAGVGFEYFLASNFSVNLESKYIYTAAQKIRLDGQPELQGDIHDFFTSIGFLIYLFNFGHKRN
jgi:opacity protein-like surface antigen